MSQKQIRSVVRAVERALNTEIPGLGPRVRYVVLPGRGIHRRKLNRRAREVLRAIRAQRGATSAELQRLLKVNRNVVAGAVHRLRQARAIKSETVTA